MTLLSAGVLLLGLTGNARAQDEAGCPKETADHYCHDVEDDVHHIDAQDWLYWFEDGIANENSNKDCKEIGYKGREFIKHKGELDMFERQNFRGIYKNGYDAIGLNMGLSDSVKSKTLVHEVAHYAGYDEEEAESLEDKCFEWSGN